jgi:hypothetical protein
MLVLVTAVVRRSHAPTSNDHSTLYPQGYMAEEVEALKRSRK